MKKLLLKNVVTLVVLVVMVTVIIGPSVFAAYDMGCAWKINRGSTHWNGKNVSGGLWDLGEVSEKRYNVSILSSNIVTVHGSLFQVIEYGSDTWITQVIFSNADSTWKGSLFVSDYGHAYYSRITEASGAGANGRTSITFF